MKNTLEPLYTAGMCDGLIFIGTDTNGKFHISTNLGSFSDITNTLNRALLETLVAHNKAIAVKESSVNES